MRSRPAASDSGTPDDQRLRQHVRRRVRQDPQRLQQGRGRQVQDRPEPDPQRRGQPARAVRPTARRPRRRHGRPRHGRHLDRRVRRGRLDPRAHRRSRRKRPPRACSSRRSTRPPGRTSSTRSRAAPTCSCSGTASRWSRSRRRPGPRSWPAARSSRPRASPTSSASPRRSTRATSWASTRSSSSLGGTLVNDTSTKVTVNDKTVQALGILHELATDGLASKSLSNSQEPEVFGQMQNGEAAFIMNWPYVLSAMKAADKKVAADLGVSTAAGVRAGRAVAGHPGWAQLRDQHLQQAPEAGLRGGHVPARREAPARRCPQPRGQRAGAGERLPEARVPEGLPLLPRTSWPS